MSLKEKYIKEILPTIQKDLGIKNVMEIPKLEKIVLNMGIGTYIRSGNKDFSSLVKDMKLIAGQAPVVVLAKKSISNFKLRDGMPVGIRVTLRGDRMFTFLEKLVHTTLPRVRDFRGVPKNAFDPQGNYNFGIKEHTVFPEVPQDDVVKPHGIQVTLKLNAKQADHGKALVKALGLPLSK